MISEQIKEKGILAKFLEQGIRLLLIKECKRIGNLQIDIFSNSIKIIKGEIQKIIIIAEDINYKDLLFDKFKLESNHLKINLKLTNKELSFINNPIVKFNISLSQNSLKTVLLSENWNWIGNLISNAILKQEKLEDIKIKDDHLLIEASDENITIDIKTDKGKVYLRNKIYNKTIQIPIEDKIYIKNVTIENNLINIFATSPISF